MCWEVYCIYGFSHRKPTKLISLRMSSGSRRKIQCHGLIFEFYWPVLVLKRSLMSGFSSEENITWVFIFFFYRVNVASLLVVALTGKMEYLTEVLLLLLLRLIDRSVASKHPQLMLRRTETVVEKMLTNWLALCMYNYLKVNFPSKSLLL